MFCPSPGRRKVAGETLPDAPMPPQPVPSAATPRIAAKATAPGTRPIVLLKVTFALYACDLEDSKRLNEARARRAG